jgi:hypothetical protein
MNPLFVTCLLFASACSVLSAQSTPTKITVVGEYRYVVKPYQYGIRLTFEEDPSKCDPAKGFLSLEEQLAQFDKQLSEIGISIRDFTTEPTFEEGNVRSKTLSYTLPQMSVVLKIENICLQRRHAKGSYLFAVMPEHDLAAEDNYALSALKDARDKATYLARKLGKRKVTVLNIDDDTSGSRRSSNWNDWYAYHNDFEATRVYHLKVTFEIQ